MFKKIISVVVCVLLLVSLWLVPANALEITTNYPKVGTMFNKLYTRNGNLCDGESKVPLQVGANPIVYYNWVNGASNDNTLLYTNLTLNIESFKMRKNIEYTVSFNIFFPSNSQLYIDKGYGGIYNFKSVDFPDPTKTSIYNYTSGCIYNFTYELNNVTDSLYWEAFTTLDGRVYDIYKVEFKITPIEDVVLNSLFYSFAYDRYNYTFAYGVSNPMITYEYNAQHYEEDSANGGGNDNIEQALDIIPNDSDMFVNAIGNLANAVSYNGTDAKLTIPAMYIPAMSGMGGRINLTNDIEFNFSPYIQMIPSSILLVIQIILSLALIVYCFKELYDIIQMVMVNKGGGE